MAFGRLRLFIGIWKVGINLGEQFFAVQSSDFFIPQPFVFHKLHFDSLYSVSIICTKEDI